MNIMSYEDSKFSISEDGDDRQSTIDAINELQQSPEAEKMLTKIKERDEAKKRTNDTKMLEFYLGRLDKVKSGNLQVIDRDDGSYSFDYYGRGDMEGARHRKTRDATKEELREEQKSLLSSLEKFGVSGTKKREGGIKDDVIFKDEEALKKFSPGAYAYVRKGRIFMPREPIKSTGEEQKKTEMFHEVAYQHELGHQRRSLGGGMKSRKGRFWSQRPEEQEATRDALNALKENWARAGIEYNPTAAYNWLGKGRDLEGIENPSKAPFTNRLKYLPESPEYKRFTISDDNSVVDYDNPEDYMNALNQISDRTWHSGSRIRHDIPEIIPRDMTHRYKTYWDLVNE